LVITSSFSVENGFGRLEGRLAQATKGLGVAALRGYICRAAIRPGALRGMLPGWLAGDSTITALIPSARVSPLGARLPRSPGAGFPKTVLM
jgi:hypothetical protein